MTDLQFRRVLRPDDPSAGTVLMMTLVLIVVGGAIAATLANMMTNRSQSITNALSSTEALYLADSGLEAAAMSLRNQNCGQSTWSVGPTAISTGNIIRGYNQFSVTNYTTGSGGWTLAGAGWVPTQAAPRGIREVHWDVPRCSCVASFPPIYMDPSQGNIQNITGGVLNGYTIANASGNAVDECAKVYSQSALTLPDFNVAPYKYPDFGPGPGAIFPLSPAGATLTPCTSSLPATSPYYNSLTVSSNNCTLTFTTALPTTTLKIEYLVINGKNATIKMPTGATNLTVYIKELQINNSNATLNLTPGHYFINNMLLYGTTTKLNYLSPGVVNPVPANVNLHTWNMDLGNGYTVWLNGASDPSTMNPSLFNLWYHNGTETSGQVGQFNNWNGKVSMAGVVLVQSGASFSPGWTAKVQKLNGGILSNGPLSLLLYGTDILTYQTAAKNAVAQILTPAVPPVRMQVGTFNEVR